MAIVNENSTSAGPLRLRLSEVESSVGREVGPGPWVTVDQERIDTFADATGDHQWIHVDRERAASGPFGRTIAHGYLTLSLIPRLLVDVLDVSERSSGVNYGMDQVRFVSPVPEGSRIRLSGRIASAQPKAGGVQYRLDLTIELEGSKKPAAVGQFLALAFP
ncbi:MaoC family dehydratase [Aeromicrobium sp. HA]|uniref:MaoC family dehydratase n=1 Tax=Aeromicrobium sp. HA TaxID=3009077 RepID=UPI0022AEC1A1|nr:MaoC family dehydratase [Aeromicrobium sp. HA]